MTTERKQSIYDLEAKREQLAGKSGVAGLFANSRLFFLAFVSLLAALNYGYEQGAYGQCMVMPSFAKVGAFSRILTDSGFKGGTVAILGFGGWVGALMNGYCCDKFSRRWSIFGGAMLVLLGTILTTAATNTDMIFAGRFFIGMAVGSLSTAVPMYCSEVAPAPVRGAMTACFQLGVTLGIMVSYFVGFGTNYISKINSVAWRLPLAIQAVPALGLAVACFFIPYSPRWLLAQGRDEEALAVLAWVRKRSTDEEIVRLEFIEIKADAVFAKESAALKFPQYLDRPLALQCAQVASLFTTWPMFRRTAITCLMMFFQQMSGIDAIVFYAPTIFQSLGLGGTAVSLLASGVVGISMFLATIPAVLFIDKLGRRPLLIAGGVGMTVCLAIVAGLTGSFEDNWPAHKGASWAAAAFIWLYIAWFGVSWGPCSWVVISELMPLSVRAPGTALGASTNWAINTCVSLFVPPMMEKITYGTYIFFIAFMLMGVAYAIWLLPETRNVSLEMMDKVFKSNDATHDAAMMERITENLQAEYFGAGSASVSTSHEKEDKYMVEGA